MKNHTHPNDLYLQNLTRGIYFQLVLTKIYSSRIIRRVQKQYVLHFLLAVRIALSVSSTMAHISCDTAGDVLYPSPCIVVFLVFSPSAQRQGSSPHCLAVQRIYSAYARSQSGDIPGTILARLMLHHWHHQSLSSAWRSQGLNSINGMDWVVGVGVGEGARLFDCTKRLNWAREKLGL